MIPSPLTETARWSQLPRVLPLTFLLPQNQPPPSSVPRAQVVVPIALKTKVQQDRAISLIKELVQSDRQQSAAIEDLEEQLFLVDEERMYAAKQLEDAQISHATVRDENLEEALVKNLSLNHEVTRLSVALETSELKVDNLSAANDALQDALEKLEGGHGQSVQVTPSNDQRVVHLERELATLRDSAQQSALDSAKQLGELSQANFSLREQIPSHEDRQCSARVQERLETALAEAKAAGCDAEKKIAKLYQTCVGLRELIPSETVQADVDMPQSSRACLNTRAPSPSFPQASTLPEQVCALEAQLEHETAQHARTTAVRLKVGVWLIEWRSVS